MNDDVNPGFYANSGPPAGKKCYAYRVTNFCANTRGGDRPAGPVSYADFRVADLSGETAGLAGDRNCGTWTRYAKAQ